MIETFELNTWFGSHVMARVIGRFELGGARVTQAESERSDYFVEGCVLGNGRQKGMVPGARVQLLKKMVSTNLDSFGLLGDAWRVAAWRKPPSTRSPMLSGSS